MYTDCMCSLHVGRAQEFMYMQYQYLWILKQCYMYMGEIVL